MPVLLIQKINECDIVDFPVNDSKYFHKNHTFKYWGNDRKVLPFENKGELTQAFFDSDIGWYTVVFQGNCDLSDVELDSQFEILVK